MRLSFAAIGILLTGATWQRARAQPLLLPSRDVDVTYHMNRPGAAPGAPELEQRLRWTADSQRLRVDPPFPGLYMLVDYRAHTLWTVRQGEKVVLRMDTGAAKMPLLPVAPKVSGADFTSIGVDHVAGLSCTDWQTRDTAGDAATICITTDGVMLRARIGNAVMMLASQVIYGPIGADIFQVPPGYREVALPKSLKALPGAAP